MNNKQEIIEKWVKFIEDKAQELNIEVSNILLIVENEIVISEISLNSDGLIFMLFTETGNYLRIKLIKNYNNNQNRKLVDQCINTITDEKKIEISIMRLFKVIKML